MKNILSLCAVSLAMAASPVFGQAAGTAAPKGTPVPLPPGPLIQKSAPAFSEWVVTIKFPPEGGSGSAASGAKSGGAGLPGESSAGSSGEQNGGNRTVMITKTGDVRREVSVASNGARTVVFRSRDIQITMEPGSKTPLLQLAADVRTAEDFHGFHWISENNFASITKVQDRDYLVFRGEAGIGELDIWQGKNAMSSAKLPAVAVIDAETRLPYSLKIGDQTSTYHFNNPPSTPLVLPPEVQAAIDERDKKVRAAQFSPPHP